MLWTVCGAMHIAYHVMKTRAAERSIGPARSNITTKVYTIGDEKRGASKISITARNINDFDDVRTLLICWQLPAAKAAITDRGDDAEWEGT
jgi:hypothetical protein